MERALCLQRHYRESPVPSCATKTGRRRNREPSLSPPAISYLCRIKYREDHPPNCLSDKERKQLGAGDEEKKKKKLPYYLFYSNYILLLYCH